MVAYAYAMDNNHSPSLSNDDKKFILAMWYYFVCHNEEYVKKYGDNVPLTQSRMIRMNELWKRMKKYYDMQPSYVIQDKYNKVFNVYPLD